MKRQALIYNGLKGSLKTKKRIKLNFFAEVQFGVLSKDCRNFGICRIIPLKYKNKNVKACCNKKMNLAEVTYIDEHTLELKFLISELEKKCIKSYFSLDHFRIEEDFSTSFKLGKSNEKRNIIIRQGKYPILKSSTFFVVKFH